MDLSDLLTYNVHHKFISGIEIENFLKWTLALYCKVGNIRYICDLLMEREFNTPRITDKLYYKYCQRCLKVHINCLQWISFIWKSVKIWPHENKALNSIREAYIGYRYGRKAVKLKLYSWWVFLMSRLKSYLHVRYKNKVSSTPYTIIYGIACRRYIFT